MASGVEPGLRVVTSDLRFDGPQIGHARDRPGPRLRYAGIMELVELPAQKRPEAGERCRSARPIGLGELAIGGTAVALENPLPAPTMPCDASGGAAVFETVDDDRRSRAAIGTIVFQIDLQAGSRSSASSREDRQGGLVGE